MSASDPYHHGHSHSHGHGHGGHPHSHGHGHATNPPHHQQQPQQAHYPSHLHHHHHHHHQMPPQHQAHSQPQMTPLIVERPLSTEQRTFRRFVAGIPNFELLSFPTLFPTGRGGFDDGTCQQQSFYDYANAMIEAHDHFRGHKGWRAFINEMAALFQGIGICGQIGGAGGSKRRKKKKKKKKKTTSQPGSDASSTAAQASTGNATASAGSGTPSASSPPAVASTATSDNQADAVLAMAKAGKTVVAAKKTSGIDYSKWDNLVVTSSDDDDDIPPSSSVNQNSAQQSSSPSSQSNPAPAGGHGHAHSQQFQHQHSRQHQHTHDHAHQHQHAYQGQGQGQGSRQQNTKSSPHGQPSSSASSASPSRASATRRRSTSPTNTRRTGNATAGIGVGSNSHGPINPGVAGAPMPGDGLLSSGQVRAFAFTGDDRVFAPISAAELKELELGKHTIRVDLTNKGEGDASGKPNAVSPKGVEDDAASGGATAAASAAKSKKARKRNKKKNRKKKKRQAALAMQNGSAEPDAIGQNGNGIDYSKWDNIHCSESDDDAPTPAGSGATSPGTPGSPPMVNIRGRKFAEVSAPGIRGISTTYGGLDDITPAVKEMFAAVFGGTLPSDDEIVAATAYQFQQQQQQQGQQFNSGTHKIDPHFFRSQPNSDASRRQPFGPAAPPNSSQPNAHV